MDGVRRREGIAFEMDGEDVLARLGEGAPLRLRGLDAAVFLAANGARDVPALLEAVRESWNPETTREMVFQSLDDLADRGLIAERAAPPAGPIRSSRRDVVKFLGAAAAYAVVGPARLASGDEDRDLREAEEYAKREERAAEEHKKAEDDNQRAEEESQKKEERAAEESKKAEQKEAEQDVKKEAEVDAKRESEFESKKDAEAGAKKEAEADEKRQAEESSKAPGAHGRERAAEAKVKADAARERAAETKVKAQDAGQRRAEQGQKRAAEKQVKNRS